MLSLCVVVCIWSLTQGADLDTSKGARILENSFDNIGTGNYQFGFKSSDGIQRQETGQIQNEGTQHEFVKVVGSFSYLGPDGHSYEVKYIADDQGFHPEGDHIRIPPFVPWIHHHDEEYNHEEFTGQRTITLNEESPRYSSSDNIPEVTKNYPSPSTQYLPENSKAEPRVVPPKTSSLENEFLHSPKTNVQPDLFFDSNS